MRQLLASAAALVLSTSLALAQLGPSANLPIGPQAGSGGGGGGGSVTFATTCPSSSQTGSSITFTNGANTKAVSTPTTLDATYCGATVEGTANITLPTTIVSGYQVSVGNAKSSGNITLSPGGSNTFNGSAGAITLQPGQYVGVFAGSGASPTNWDVAGATSVSVASGTDPGYVTSQWYLGVNFSGANTTGAALTTGTAFCTAQKLMNPVQAGGGSGTIGSLALRITTLGTSTITEAIYQDGLVGGLHRPLTLLGYTAQVANTSVTTLTGALNAGVSLSSQLIWTCATQGDSTGKVALMSLGSNIGYVGNSSATSIVTNTGFGVTFPVTYGASAALTWPASNSAATFSETTNVTPLVMFQFSSIP